MTCVLSRDVVADQQHYIFSQILSDNFYSLNLPSLYQYRNWWATKDVSSGAGESMESLPKECEFNTKTNGSYQVQCVLDWIVGRG